MVFARCISRAAFLILLISLTAIAQKAVADPLVLEVSQAEVGFDARTGEPIILARLTQASGNAFGAFTRENVGRKIEFRFEGKVLTAPVLMTPITGGSLQISGSLAVDAARDIADRLSKGGKVEVVQASD